jgi:hypothetical protein
MRLRTAVATAWLAVGLPACREGQSDDAARAGAAAVPSASVGTAAADTGTSRAGLPTGFRVRMDDPKKLVFDIKFAKTPTGALDVNAGTHEQNLAHILYRDTDTASGRYVVRAEIDQLSTPDHPEAVGILIGGRDLAGPGQRYGYFIVRGDGQFSVKRRNRDSAAIVVPFTPSPNVPKSDAAHHAVYRLTLRVDADSIRFLVADKPVVAVVRSAIPTNGVVGIRINHGLHVIVTPLAISR